MFEFLRQKKTVWVQLPLPKPDMSNKRHFPICKFFEKGCPCEYDPHTEDIGYLDTMYLKNTQNINYDGTQCKLFNHNFYCPFVKWMKENRERKRRFDNGR